MGNKLFKNQLSLITAICIAINSVPVYAANYITVEYGESAQVVEPNPKGIPGVSTYDEVEKDYAQNNGGSSTTGAEADSTGTNTSVFVRFDNENQNGGFNIGGGSGGNGQGVNGFGGNGGSGAGGNGSWNNSGYGGGSDSGWNFKYLDPSLNNGGRDGSGAQYIADGSWYGSDVWKIPAGEGAMNNPGTGSMVIGGVDFGDVSGGNVDLYNMFQNLPKSEADLKSFLSSSIDGNSGGLQSTVMSYEDFVALGLGNPEMEALYNEYLASAKDKQSQGKAENVDPVINDMKRLKSGDDSLYNFPYGNYEDMLAWFKSKQTDTDAQVADMMKSLEDARKELKKNLAKYTESMARESLSNLLDSMLDAENSAISEYFNNYNRQALNDLDQSKMLGTELDSEEYENDIIRYHGHAYDENGNELSNDYVFSRFDPEIEYADGTKTSVDELITQKGYDNLTEEEKQFVDNSGIYMSDVGMTVKGAFDKYGSLDKMPEDVYNAVFENDAYVDRLFNSMFDKTSLFEDSMYDSIMGSEGYQTYLEEPFDSEKREKYENTQKLYDAMIATDGKEYDDLKDSDKKKVEEIGLYDDYTYYEYDKNSSELLERQRQQWEELPDESKNYIRNIVSSGNLDYDKDSYESIAGYFGYDGFDKDGFMALITSDDEKTEALVDSLLPPSMSMIKEAVDKNKEGLGEAEERISDTKENTTFTEFYDEQASKVGKNKAAENLQGLEEEFKEKQQEVSQNAKADFDKKLEEAGIQTELTPEQYVNVYKFIKSINDEKIEPKMVTKKESWYSLMKDYAESNQTAPDWAGLPTEVKKNAIQSLDGVYFQEQSAHDYTDFDRVCSKCGYAYNSHKACHCEHNTKYMSNIAYEYGKDKSELPIVGGSIKAYNYGFERFDENGNAIDHKGDVIKDIYGTVITRDMIMSSDNIPYWDSKLGIWIANENISKIKNKDTSITYEGKNRDPKTSSMDGAAISDFEDSLFIDENNSITENLQYSDLEAGARGFQKMLSPYAFTASMDRDSNEDLFEQYYKSVYGEEVGGYYAQAIKAYKEDKNSDLNAFNFIYVQATGNAPLTEKEYKALKSDSNLTEDDLIDMAATKKKLLAHNLLKVTSDIDTSRLNELGTVVNDGLGAYIISKDGMMMIRLDENTMSQLGILSDEDIKSHGVDKESGMLIATLLKGYLTTGSLDDAEGAFMLQILNAASGEDVDKLIEGYRKDKEARQAYLDLIDGGITSIKGYEEYINKYKKDSEAAFQKVFDAAVKAKEETKKDIAEDQAKNEQGLKDFIDSLPASEAQRKKAYEEFVKKFNEYMKKHPEINKNSDDALPQNLDLWTVKDLINALEKSKGIYNGLIITADQLDVPKISDTDVYKLNDSSKMSADDIAKKFIPDWPSDQSLWTDKMRQEFENIKQKYANDTTIKDMIDKGVFVPVDIDSVIKLMEEYKESFTIPGRVFIKVSSDAMYRGTTTTTSQKSWKVMTGITSVISLDGKEELTLKGGYGQGVTWLNAGPVGTHVAKNTYSYADVTWQQTWYNYTVYLTASIPGYSEPIVITSKDVIVQKEDLSPIKTSLTKTENLPDTVIEVKLSDLDTDVSDFFSTERVD